jgi:formate hydrogenlyase transcriptional activator
MITTSNELAAPSREQTIGKLPGSFLGKGCGLESFVNDHRCAEGGINNWPFARNLLQFLSELMDLPAFSEVQAFRAWLCPPEDRAVQVDLLMANLPSRIRAGIEMPLDDTIAAWVWQHQCPLIIAGENENRFPDFARLLLERGINYFCAVPLIIANRRIGVLGLASTRREALSESDIEFIRRGMTNIGGANKNNGALQHAPETHRHTHGEEVFLDAGASSEDNFEGIIGRSAVMHAVHKQVKVVAPTGSTALILGETGTGKELIARAIHNLSPRRKRPFIKVNCAAIPAGLIESELFGHERGAFTGAIVRRTGRFEMADGGTLFLDEIGDIPLDLQPKLLRVLQEQEFERVGGTQTTRVDVRIVAATSRDLPRMVAAREFRADLYYRLNIFPLRVPALRERLEDVPLLVRHFVEVYSRKAGKRITDVPAETLRVLLSHTWPGNVRELQNVIERAVILSTGKVLRQALDELQPSSQTEEAVGVDKKDPETTLRDAEREHIIRALAATAWILGGPQGAAARLGLPRTTLIAKMQKLGITRAQA